MSLLQNEDFVLYQLRTAYLSAIKDGVGERLINVDTTVLNNPAFRAAGWVPNNADIKRTYSPPIPTAITSEYFQAPRSAGLKIPDGLGDDEDEGGMVTGGGSNDTVGPRLNTKRRRRKEQLQEDDSSDLSDDSEEEGDGTQRPVNQIKFTKMPLRTRAGSSPIPGSALRNELIDNVEGPSVFITSPSRPPDSRLRRGSLGAVDTIKERARRDTVTSSELSSENEMESAAFPRKRINPHRAAKASNLLSQRIQEDEREKLEDLHEDNESDSSLSSEFSGSADSASILGEQGPLDSSPSSGLPGIQPPITPFNTSPKKQPRQPLPGLQALPPPRPISIVPPVSALTQALQAKGQPSNPLQRFASWSGAVDPKASPLYIKIYCPFSSAAFKPMELLLKRVDDNGVVLSVAEAIGFALWRYQEENMEPPLAPEKMNVNCWVMRMYDDGEVDDEFPPLTRNKPLVDFASNNSRGMRPRARDKPWDEFALVEASEREYGENEKLTPTYSREAATALASQKSSSDEQLELKTSPKPVAARVKSFRNPIIGPSFAPSATRKDSSNLMDAPAGPTTHAAARVGAPRTVTVHYMDERSNTRHMAIPCTTDTYIAEIFDKFCNDLGLEKGLFVLKVSGSTTVAPTDRTVEALGSRMDLDLIRRRFVGDGIFGLAGSPGSSSPNAPLIISTGGATKKGKKADRTITAVGGISFLNPLGPKHDALLGPSSYYRRYAVLRKQPMSFASSTARILALDNEYIHIMPGETTSNTKALFEAQSKTTRVHFSSVVGSKVSKKHPKMFRVIVFKERETKRYDFEAVSHEEAVEIVREIKTGIARFQEGIM
ncbi:hypothetical protein GQ43DRAFT_483723 [Delitschia confertaspora ATCC 74209]|uniref:Stress-activated map kinase-interacting protein n=1 Tax=Delitschia confertaspora ATCC 74209 TaxID=1513339 RepID=A0A9P4MVE6_9PLEO|nr:hypothetical protein GQ43DRAFT_483723 [Delitschia confertaspora ATCC 74209]